MFRINQAEKEYLMRRGYKAVRIQETTVIDEEKSRVSIKLIGIGLTKNPNSFNAVEVGNINPLLFPYYYDNITIKTNIGTFLCKEIIDKEMKCN